ncbi:MAG: class I SAM-dependent methyltransferase [Cyanobacteria bacterium P01_F01_bin.53]
MWNHNIHFHNYLLHHISGKLNRALDIGCGLGLFARKLSRRSEYVEAIDVDSEILKEASIQNSMANISYQNVDFLEADLPNDSYDLIVSIASLHHMDLEPALRKMKALLRPSGKLLILGLYREVTIWDHIYSVISVPLNYVYSSWHRTSILRPRKRAPTRPAQLSLRQIKAVARTVIPGFRLRRHLFWRYSLIWQKQ